MGRIEKAGLRVEKALADFINERALPGSGVEPRRFWEGLSALLHDLGPRNQALLQERDSMQAAIDRWHIEHRSGQPDSAVYRRFLESIGYLVPEGPAFKISTGDTDPEFSRIAGPQLVVPITNARYALNAANARWGSLYDALYGTDALGDLTSGSGYDLARGARVIAWARDFLDRAVPLAQGSWSDIDEISIRDGALFPALRDPAKFVAYRGDPAQPDNVFLRNNGLLLRICFDPEAPVARQDRAGISDIVMESALSVIMDCEDSVACVDGEDKAHAYANWLGLMDGTLTETIEKDGHSFTRRLNDDIDATSPDGTPLRFRGRAVMLVRNVGHLMTTPAVLDRDGKEVYEGLLDAMVTVLCAMRDLDPGKEMKNSTAGSIYIVKPKMHGPAEVAFSVETFDRVEEILGLPRNTVKIGIMDEERRTSINLAECIRAARERVAFINTGFLDRTGDEYHTSLEAGPMLAKGEMKNQPWIGAYEDRNVDIGLACGLSGRAQIGKGMWAAPDLMAEMLRQKIGHPQSGANTAWVPSPTAATLHATHYHLVDVFSRQAELIATPRPDRLDNLLTPPLAQGRNYAEAELQAEIDNNCQGILGYVVRWIDQGIGVSKVPDIHNIGLMEDRATLRISSQQLVNWLLHEVVTESEVMDGLRRMAQVVDAQNAGDPNYRPMAPGYDGFAFQAACDLIFLGRMQPSGYTERILHARRQQVKASRLQVREAVGE